jgi:hypothetical protein
MGSKGVTMSNMTSSLRRPGCAAALAVFSGACSAETIDLGEVSRNLSGDSRCQQSTLIEGSVVIENQAQLDQLEGCEQIAGNFHIRPFAGADFRPLAALHTVGGALDLGRLTVFDLLSLPLEVQERIGEIMEQEQALLDSGCFSALEGFEGLERVGSLSLNGVGAPNLLAFSSLAALTDGGSLVIGACANLRDLAGLERLSGVVELTQSCNSLESLDGPRFARRMGNAFIFGTSLADLGSFAPESVNELRIEDTALQSLDALSQLARASSIDIFGNRALTNVDALATLNDVGYLRIGFSPLLERLPELTSMVRLETLSIVFNDALENFPSMPNLGIFPGETDWGNLAPEEALWLRPDIIEVTANAALESIVIPAGWLAASYIEIISNERLTSIDLANIQAVDGLSIAANTALTSVDLGLLETVDDLRVIDNPLLPLEPFDAVQTFRRVLQTGPLELDQN